jgi:hypothetical protein
MYIAWAHAQLFRFAIHFLMNALNVNKAPLKAGISWNYAILNLAIWRELLRVRKMSAALLKILDTHYIIFLTCMTRAMKLCGSLRDLDTVKFHAGVCYLRSPFYFSSSAILL